MLHNTLIDINGMDLEARTQFPFSSQNVRNVKCFLDHKKKYAGLLKSQNVVT